MTVDALGSRCWVLPGGSIPIDSTGPEPAMVSYEQLCLLNTGASMAVAEVTLAYTNGRDAGPYNLTVGPERVRHVRINDLIDPYAPPLGKAFGIHIESTEPIVVQWTRQDTRQTENATMTTLAWAPAEDE